jgi:hypothetical protein
MNGEGILSGESLNDIADRAFLGRYSHYDYLLSHLTSRKEPKNVQSIDIKHQPVQTRKGLNHGCCHCSIAEQFTNVFEMTYARVYPDDS